MLLSEPELIPTKVSGFASFNKERAKGNALDCCSIDRCDMVILHSEESALYSLFR